MKTSGVGLLMAIFLFSCGKTSESEPQKGPPAVNPRGAPPAGPQLGVVVREKGRGAGHALRYDPAPGTFRTALIFRMAQTLGPKKGFTPPPMRFVISSVVTTEGGGFAVSSKILEGRVLPVKGGDTPEGSSESGIPQQHIVEAAGRMAQSAVGHGVKVGYTWQGLPRYTRQIKPEKPDPMSTGIIAPILEALGDMVMPLPQSPVGEGGTWVVLLRGTSTGIPPWIFTLKGTKGSSLTIEKVNNPVATKASLKVADNKKVNLGYKELTIKTTLAGDTKRLMERLVVNIRIESGTDQAPKDRQFKQTFDIVARRL